MLRKNFRVYKNIENEKITINIYTSKFSFNDKYFYIET